VIFAAFFMLGIPFAMRHDAHVRVDIVYQRLTTRQRAAIDLTGTVLFLLPWLALVGWYSLPIVLNSLFEMEKFAETYTPGYFILKLQLFFLVALVGLQAIANIINAALVLTRTSGDRR
jgi:TRAP-type mannitol/chloroaromatic compound transport system permease small subunit